MNPHDLAWKGITVAEKRELLDHSLFERTRLIGEGKAKDGLLGLASTCIDIIGTAHAALKSGDNPEWKQILDETMSLSKEAVHLAEEQGTEDWFPSDFEVAGDIVLKTSGDAVHATELFVKGVMKAEQDSNAVMRVLLLGKLVRAACAQGDRKEVYAKLMDLHKAIIETPLDLQTETRVYRILAVGAKFVAIQAAIEAGSENQELKARSI